MARQRRIKAVLMRGGTSRGVFFHCGDLPGDPVVRDRVILAVLGGGDPYGRQIDGLGGATSTTSKVAMVGPPSVPDADVDYTFGQVSVTTPHIDYGGTCGNLTAAIGPFAIEEGMVRGIEPATVVRIWQTNTRKRIVARIPIGDGLPLVEGDYAIDGVPGTGAQIVLEFLDPGGAMTRALLPTGHPADTLIVPGVGTLTASLVDAVNPVALVPAAALGLTGTETPDRIDGDAALLTRIEAVRGQAAVVMGLARTPEEARTKTPGVPKLAIIGGPATYQSTRGVTIDANRVDVVGRIMSMGRLHRAYAASGAACTAVAALIQGTIVHDLVRPGPAGERTVRIGHPAGVIEIGAAVRRRSGEWVAEKVVTRRTARRLMEGYACVPASIWPLDVPAAAHVASQHRGWDREHLYYLRGHVR
jgi:2-methylaconitate cis-trans-isomerase PrpF